MNKICYSCKIDKPSVEFYRNASNKDGLSFICKECYNRPEKKQQVEVYMHPRYFKMFIADCFAAISSKADKLTQILNSHITVNDKKQE